MVTKDQATRSPHGTEFHYTGPSGMVTRMNPCTRKVGPRGGVKETVIRARVTGACKTWKTRPADFRLPVKHGMYESGAIDQDNSEHWHLAADCPLVENTEGECNGIGME